MQLALRASRPQISSQKPEFWTQLDADSGRSGHLGRDELGAFHLSIVLWDLQRLTDGFEMAQQLHISSAQNGFLGGYSVLFEGRRKAAVLIGCLTTTLAFTWVLTRVLENPSA
jgi:hypothetical protein